jgi:hypothetical protein
MRTTVRLDEDLLRAAKQRAVQTGRTLTAVIEEALRRLLATSEEQHTVGSVELPVFRGRPGLRPAVDLDDSAGLLDLMEGT